MCLAASLFRHNARDYDDQGRRIPCPRLGVVTCGEHVALEKLLWEKYLSDGERVAPRHALILPGGKKAWDLSLCFDLHDIDKALFESVRADAARREQAGSTGVVESPVDGASWAELAARRDAFGRSALEDAIARVRDPASLAAGLDAIEKHGDPGSLDALRIVCARLPDLSASMRDRVLATTRALHLEPDVTTVLRGRVQALGVVPASLDPAGCETLLPLLAELDGKSTATRSLLLACGSVAEYGDAPRAALDRAFGAENAAPIETAIDDQGGPVSLRDLLRIAGAATRGTAAGDLPKHGSITDAMPDADTLANTLNDLDHRMKDVHGDPALDAQYAKASLDLARRHIESQQQDAQILLQDAELHFARALDKEPDHYEWWVERARTAYFLQDFEHQVTFGRRALALAGTAAGDAARDLTSPTTLANDRAIEALRWIGDGDARLLADRAGKDPVAEIGGMLEGLRALAVVAASAYGDATDWTSFASFCGALGLWREELAIAEAGAMRLPAAAELRQRLNDSLWNGGQVALAPELADRIAQANAPSADAQWFSGYAYVLAAEQDRREEHPRSAIREYVDAAERYRSAIDLRPDYADNCNYWIAMTWLGRGLAHARAGERAEAADCLVEAVGTGAALTEARDGLGYEALDLVDKICEWRESGPSPVEPIALLDRLDEVAPDEPFWAAAISDSELREALRADGRNPVREERETVDAAGNPIRMPMGLPTEEGDAYLRASIAAGRRAAERAKTDDDKHPLAQADTIWAERMLQRGRSDGVAEALAEAAPLMGVAAPADDADVDALRAVAATLRAVLGEARPKLRPGR